MSEEKIPVFIDPQKEIPWYQESLGHSSDLLIIAFSISNEKFDWSNFLAKGVKHLDLNEIWIADFDNSWWMGEYKGIEGYGIHSAVKFLQNKISEHKYRKIITLGSSKGALGAILFGTHLNVDSVYAFSPKTHMRDSMNNKYSITKNLDLLKEKLEGFNYNIDDFDSRKLILEKRIKTKYNLFFGKFCKDDIKHVDYISDFEFVKTFDYPSNKHGGTAKYFMGNGIIGKMLEEEIKI